MSQTAHLARNDNEKAAPFDWESFGHEQLNLNGLSFHVACSGINNSKNPPILLLHGFPDLWCVWARVMAELVPDYACFAPDLRGYNKTSRPGDVADYAPQHLLRDVAALVEAVGSGGPVVLVGHDWGGVLASWFAARHPEKIDKLILINTTHPVAFQRALWSDPEQRAASAYIEEMRSGRSESVWLSAGTEALFQNWTANALERGQMCSYEADLFRAAWSDRVAWRAMIDWYRASPFQVAPGPPTHDWTVGQDWIVTPPTLFIWGNLDGIFTRGLQNAQNAWFPTLEHIRLEGIGHNPMREAPYQVANAIKSFLKQE